MCKGSLKQMPSDKIQKMTENKLQPCTQKEGGSLLFNSPGAMGSGSQESSRGGSMEVCNRNVEIGTNGSVSISSRRS